MSVPTFVAAGPFVPGQSVTLGGDDVHHMRVRRIDVGAAVALVDGEGSRATGVVVRVVKRNATVEVHASSQEPAPRGLHLLLPIADKERMLLLAEKAAELGATSWRPVTYRRSRSVAGRGEGPMFTRKVLARMTGALEQSGSAWLPMVYPDATLERAIAAAPDGIRIVLDAGAPSLAGVLGHAAESADGAPLVVAVGPEGGIETDELAQLTGAGFVRASIGGAILRFETAAIAGLGVAQSFIHVAPNGSRAPRAAQEA
ncbi:MAG TPA: RsmE family RNA methyltransferase [Gemmatimonadaceae bacterium]|nr:RsmE family RNA methyltransferase [Gemmatimonadaceae bacterium]